MSFRFLSVSCLLVAGAAGCAQNAPAPEGHAGTWVMRLGPKTLLVLTLKKSGDGFTGTLTRPEHFQTSDGVRFSRLTPVTTSEVIASASLQDNRLHLVTANPKDREDRTEYDMTTTGPDEASIQLSGAPFDPWPLTRIRGATRPAVSTDWDPGRSYSLDDRAESSAEMQRIFEEDQKVRQDPGSLSSQDWAVIGPQDAQRREQTGKLLAEGRLHTAEDFSRAAFVFQHGSTPDDYLLAHTLAMIAVAKGSEDALWIGSATLDRYLQSIGKPQIYGTQFRQDANKAATQQPYDEDLVSDALRRQLGVPSRAAQQEQLQRYAEQFSSATAR